MHPEPYQLASSAPRIHRCRPRFARCSLHMLPKHVKRTPRSTSASFSRGRPSKQGLATTERVHPSTYYSDAPGMRIGARRNQSLDALSECPAPTMSNAAMIALSQTNNLSIASSLTRVAVLLQCPLAPAAPQRELERVRHSTDRYTSVEPVLYMHPIQSTRQPARCHADDRTRWCAK